MAIRAVGYPKTTYPGHYIPAYLALWELTNRTGNARIDYQLIVLQNLVEKLRKVVNK